MTIEKIKEQLKTSDTPVAKAFHVSEDFKVLLFGFNKGMKLEDHTAKRPTKLLVVEGDIIYSQQKRETRMKKFDEIEIPPNVPHSVSALDNSFIILTQG